MGRHPDLTATAAPSYGRIFATFLPLALMWLMIGVEQPLVAAVVARLPDAGMNLAAHGVAFGIGVVIQSPTVQLLSASTALSGSSRSYRRLRLYSLALCTTVTAVHLVVGLTPLYVALATWLMGVPAEVARHSRGAFLLMTPYAFSVGFRRLWQGVLIRHGRAGIIPATMLLRMGAVVAAAAVGLLFPVLPGSSLGAATGSFGLLVGALVSGAFAGPIARRLAPGGEPMSWPDLNRFYLPMAATSVIMLATRPLLTTGVARSAFALESLAVWPVVAAMLFLFQSMAFSYQEVVVALYSGEESRQRLQRFAWVAAAALAVPYLFMVIPAVGGAWFRGVAGLPEDLVGHTRVPVLLLALVVPASLMQSYYRGVLIHRRRTVSLTVAIAINAATITGVLVAGIAFLSFSGVVLASCALVAAMVIEAAYLGYQAGATGGPS
jgi:hypothetical protein